MRRYKLSYGLAGFLNSLSIFYTMFWASLPLSILYTIVEKNIYISLICYLIFICIFVGILLINLLLFLITRITAKDVLFYNYYELIYKDKAINIHNIKTISFILGKVGGRYQKDEPYRITIKYKNDIENSYQYLSIDRFPIELLYRILKSNKNIHFEKPEIKPLLKRNLKYGLITGIILTIICYISKISGYK